ncbi:ribosome biogenesis protein WDR12 homolog [Biomphalaria glabrata]|uniref:Ribosome biogenesis protein WDR12 homolog n=1 Tax=Biomphalaria glabrata TaxID=6526 RepID=A0A9W2Z258_BIOGL|nr:ribosome biogenesis protein WDR12 homolog [Biomphalaria glabrata]KAI8777872.1 ribosome biogenesis protein WDR12 [Biomphalaria glabrata]
MATEDVVPHVQAKFFTRQEQYSIPDNPYSIPASITAKELNNIIYSVLNEGKTANSFIEFDFLIHGEFLRTSLETHLEEKNVSSEAVIEIEYVERQAAPRPETSLAHDDWVSCVRGSNSLILCGCYDNTLKLWSRDGKCLTTISGHLAPVKCVEWIPSNGGSTADRMFISGSQDQTLLVWCWKESQKAVDCLYACKGHAGSVDCAAVNTDGARIVTGSWDKMVKLWSLVDGLTVEEEEGERTKKKLKSSGKSVSTRVPLVTLSGHKEAVSSVTWLDGSTICTSSWDHTLRVWDMTRSEQTQIVEGSKAFFSIAYSPLSKLILSASADKHVRLHDLRTKEMKSTYTSHTGLVSSVDWSKVNEHLFISGSHDMLMKLWDTRSPKAPLYNLIGQDDKILAVDWSIPELMLSGGADNQLKIFNYELRKKMK